MRCTLRVQFKDDDLRPLHEDPETGMTADLFDELAHMRVVLREIDGVMSEPFELLSVDVEEANQGAVMEALGVRWALDLGADNYNMPGYFGGNRWTYYRLRAESHNTLVINSGKTSTSPDQNPKAVAPIAKFESRPGRVIAIADLSAAYAGMAKQARRGIALVDRRTVLVQDEVEAERPSDVWWFMTVPTASTGRGKRRAAETTPTWGALGAVIAKE